MVCVYCGCGEGRTRDHVPPKCLIRSPYPADLLTVPACTDCNRDFSRDEEYFRLVIVGLLCHTAEADLLFDGSLSRSMNRNRGLEDRMLGSLEASGNQVLLDIEYPRVFRIAEKIARGLEFVESGTLYSLDQRFEVEFHEVEGGSRETEFGPDFTYCRCGPGGWEFTLFDSVRFNVRLAEPDAAVDGRKAGRH